MLRCWLFASSALVVCALSSAGCGDDASGGDDGAGGAGGADDGKVRPEPNGVRISEDQACQALKTAQAAQIEAVGGCVVTARDCPDLVRVISGAQCAPYDEGSVQGCIAYYGTSTDCESASAAFAACEPTSYVDEAPAGCP